MKYKRFRAIEVALTSLALWWGIILLLPFNTFEISSAYDAMKGIASEYKWGLFMLGLGLFQLIGMIINDLYTKKITLLVATGVWFFIASMFSAGELVSTGTGTYAIIGCLSGWLYMKVGGQFGR